jgi:hypothetical protein
MECPRERRYILAKEQKPTDLAAYRARKKAATLQQRTPTGSSYEQFASPSIVPQIHGKTERPADGGASITMAFTPETIDQRYLERIEDFLAVRISQRRFFLEIVLYAQDARGKDLPRPPDAWFTSLSVVIQIPQEEEIHSPVVGIAAEKATDEGIKMTLATQHCPLTVWVPTKPEFYRGATIKLLAPSSFHMKKPDDVERLLLARPRF